MKYSFRKSILALAIPVLLTACQTKTHEDHQDNDESKEIAEDKNDAKFDEKDAEKNAQFVVDAVSASLATIKLATLAEERAVSKDVKELASFLKTQHTALEGQLKTYAAAKVISIPEVEPEKAENKAKKLNDKENFDKKWVAEIKDMQEKAIKSFEDASNDLSDPELKNLAAQALPTLRTQYDRIVASEEKLK